MLNLGMGMGHWALGIGNNSVPSPQFLIPSSYQLIPNNLRLRAISNESSRRKYRSWKEYWWCDRFLQTRYLQPS